MFSRDVRLQLVTICTLLNRWVFLRKLVDSVTRVTRGADVSVKSGRSAKSGRSQRKSARSIKSTQVRASFVDPPVVAECNLDIIQDKYSKNHMKVGRLLSPRGLRSSSQALVTLVMSHRLCCSVETPSWGLRTVPLSQVSDTHLTTCMKMGVID